MFTSTMPRELIAITAHRHHPWHRVARRSRSYSALATADGLSNEWRRAVARFACAALSPQVATLHDVSAAEGDITAALW